METEMCVCVCLCVCGGGGGIKHPNAPLTSPSPSPSCLIPLPRAAPEFPGCHELPVLSPGGDAAGVAAPGPAGLRLRSGSVPEGGRRVFFCCGISCWRGRGDYLLPAAFLCPRHKARRGHVRWKAPESRGGDGKKGRGASEASLLASAVNSCRGGGGGAGLFSETGVLGGGCVPWGLFFGVTLW